METYEITCESCGKRVEITIGNGQLTKESFELKCLECKLKEKGERAERLLKVVFS